MKFGILFNRKLLHKPSKRPKKVSDDDEVSLGTNESPVEEELSDKESGVVSKKRKSKGHSSVKKKKSKHAIELSEEDTKRKKRSSKKSKRVRSTGSSSSVSTQMYI